MAKRELITALQVQDAANAGQRVLKIAPDALITPLARDEARARGLTFAEQETAAEPGVRTGVVAIGADHGGFRYKAQLKPFIKTLGWSVLDLGVDAEVPCDYPDYAFAVARAVALGKCDFGVMIDGTGLNSAVVCNKVPGIRAVSASNEFAAVSARSHGDAQILTLGSRTLGIEVCKALVTRFLSTAFDGGRHQRRVDKISEVEARFSRDSST